MKRYDSYKLMRELQAASIPFKSCNSDGVIGFLDEATPEQIALAQTILEAHNPDTPLPDEAAQLQVLANIRTLVQSAAGVAVQDLTAAQVRALVAVLLHKAGAIDNSGKIRPPGEWVK